MFGKSKDVSNDKHIEIPTREIKENKREQVQMDSTVISAGLSVKGVLSGSTNMEIYGTVEGEINLGNNAINIETTAKIKANINAKSIRVNGSVVGNLVASEKILITNKGSVVGDIGAGNIEIQDGANFDGNISMKKTSNNNPNPNNNKK